MLDFPVYGESFKVMHLCEMLENARPFSRWSVTGELGKNYNTFVRNIHFYFILSKQIHACNSYYPFFPLQSNILFYSNSSFWAIYVHLT